MGSYWYGAFCMHRYSIIPIFLIVLVDMLAMMMIVPLLPFYAQSFGASAVTIGFLGASFAVCQLIAAPLLGRLSDRVGRKPVLVFSQIGTLIGFILMAFANQLWILFVARILDGITAGNLPLAQAYIADTTPPENRAKAFGVIGVAFGIGLVVGPAFSGWLAAYSWKYPVYCAALFSLLSIFATVILLPAPTQETIDLKIQSSPKRFWSLFSETRILNLLLQFSVFVFAFSYFAQGLGLFAQARFLNRDGKPFGPTEIGYLFAYCGVLGIFIQGWLIGKIVPRYGETRLVRIAFLCDIVGYALLGFSTTLPLLILSCTLFSFGNSMLRPLLTSLITRNVSREEQGGVLGVTSSLQSLGGVITPPLGGILIDTAQFTPWALVLSAGCCVGFGISVSKNDRKLTL